MAAPAPPALPALDGTLGVIQIGLVIATWLFGIETLQTFNYYRDFGNDPKVLRGLVGAIWLLEVGHTIAGWHAMYSITVTFYGKPQHILSPPISMVYPILFHAFIAMAVQTFFVYRVRVVSKQWVIPIICFILNLGRLACLLLLFGGLYQTPLFTLLTTKFNKEVIVASSMGPGVEVVVAGSLLYYLWQRRAADFGQTNRIVDSIIVWTVGRKFHVDISGSIQLVLFLTRRNDLSWLVFFLIQAKLFSNSLLASLNGRKRFRTPDNHVVAFNSTGHGNPNSVIRMQQMSETVYDDDMRPSQNKPFLVGGLLTESEINVRAPTRANGIREYEMQGTERSGNLTKRAQKENVSTSTPKAVTQLEEKIHVSE
ncbi:hypothetical protein B0H19DRAFT_1062254 [Mycena capillaripes]|nr:hypothetical protein B0H19DRAFT_1062254 [Mycena capillaripes]